MSTNDPFATLALVARGELSEGEIKKVLKSVFGSVPRLENIDQAKKIIKVVEAHRPFLPAEGSVIIVAKGSIEISMNNVGDFVPLTKLDKINGDKKARFIVSYKFMPFVYRAAENGAVLIMIQDLNDFLSRTTSANPNMRKKITKAMVDSRIPIILDVLHGAGDGIRELVKTTNDQEDKIEKLERSRTRIKEFVDEEVVGKHTIPPNTHTTFDLKDTNAEIIAGVAAHLSDEDENQD